MTVTQKRILIVDDDDEIRELLEFDVAQSGYFVDTARDGLEGLNKALNNSYDLILLDVMMPKMNGFDVAKNIRQAKLAIPILMLTAKGTIDDKTEGFDCGADDYLVKPYAIEELLARIRALSRRPKDFSDHTCLSYLDIRFDPDTRTITCRDKEELLSKRKALLMEFFMRNPDKTLTREQIYSRVWGPDGTVEDGNLDTYIYFLRKHLLTLKSRACIQTVHGMGYRLEGNHVS